MRMGRGQLLTKHAANLILSEQHDGYSHFLFILFIIVIIVTIGIHLIF